MRRAAKAKLPVCACGQPRPTKRGYCNACFARYMRDYRKDHPLNEQQRLRDNARAYLRVYIQRGKVDKGPCEVCGNAEAQPHHVDYKQPLDVLWRCSEHRLEPQNEQRRTATAR